MKIHISRWAILDNVLLKGMDIPGWTPIRNGGYFFSKFSGSQNVPNNNIPQVISCLENVSPLKTQPPSVM